MVRMFNELKETVEWTANKIQEEMKAEIRKLQTEVPLIKNLVDEMKNSVGVLNSRMIKLKTE